MCPGVLLEAQGRKSPLMSKALNRHLEEDKLACRVGLSHGGLLPLRGTVPMKIRTPFLQEGHRFGSL